ncbi:MAG: type II toxin-antitoxin system Phd/YefM family antitoxin [Anaerolinea sp.]|nr:type II toxin-antitoxin system Phd/YefM family antitoxin [Anaerolinea sp.]
MVTLHPNILEQEGKKQFVILPYSEFIALQEELQDYYDLKELQEAKEKEKDAPTVSFAEAQRSLGLV